ncbi:zinc-dependent alcohol dehydrogenase family protein [Flavobacterium soyangense]|uniref:Zinc-dependent alcohol dehydrogenase family protein n=1 Tax=Flavobacterium soyangense TaxID=2023265 RepID=A0A930UCY6_9FLAO|nr:zinc-dependent alcohol dehydrogenase family protein [Flavobacterium soyangense]MBF2709912.1 zinc-dependent alcohol dehydrogenase family protein [Flavobacterium soyangense]
MKAVTFKNTGEPIEVLEVQEIPLPEPKINEVRVKILASPINPSDILFIKGVYRLKPEFTQTAGLEGVGIIDKIGKNVNLPLNTLVAFRHKNVWAEYGIIPVEKLTLLPADFPIEKASQFSLNPITAFALLDEASVQNDEWLLITAGSSSISKMIVQLANRKNIKTIAVVKNEKDLIELQNLGATETLIDNRENIVQKVLKITNNKGVNCILDAVGGQLISELLKSMASNGQLITFGLLSSENVAYHNSTIIFKNITIKGFGIDNWLANITIDKNIEVYEFLIDTLADPEFKMPVVAKFNIFDFKKAIQLFQVGNNPGKILLLTN